MPGIASGTMNLLLFLLGLVALITGSAPLDAARHAPLPRSSAIMQSFVLALMIITLLVVMYGHRSRHKR